jgi:hypothetical protein
MFQSRKWRSLNLLSSELELTGIEPRLEKSQNFPVAPSTFNPELWIEIESNNLIHNIEKTK